MGPNLKRFGFGICFGVVLLGLASGLTGCASDEARLKESREAYLANDLPRSEKALFTQEVFNKNENRLMHFCKLSSIAFSEGQYEKAIYFLNKARDTSKSNRSETGFNWLLSGDYRGNPLEYSYLHFYLIMAYELLADAGRTPAWSTGEIKGKDGILVQAQSFPERVFDAREISELRQKAHAELLAWDVHLENLKNLFGNTDYYQEDLLARTLGAYIQGSSSDLTEKRTGEILSQDALKILTKEFVHYPSHSHEDGKIQDLEKQLQVRAQGKAQGPGEFFFVEAGVMDPYKAKRYHLGMSTLFKSISNPGLRNTMERVGLQVILATAPSFGLIMVAGGVAGAIEGSGDEDDQVHYFSDAVDRSFGFEISFPSLNFPPPDTQVKLDLLQNGQLFQEVQVPVLSPLQEMISTEMKAREDKDMFAKAVTIGTEYLSVLIPAIVAYRQSKNILQKIGIIAGYYLAKKAIDAANNPDLRSWDYLPKLIAGTLLTAPAGNYQGRIRIMNSQGGMDRDLGTISLGLPNQLLIYRRIGDLPILKTPKATAIRRH